jgi:protoheme IX farnesyltransferase
VENMNMTVQTVVSDAPPSGVLGPVLQLSKPGVTRLVMVTALCGALVAPQAIDPLNLFLALVSTALVVAGANALNMYLERDVDAKMERTRNRPIPAGRISPEFALWFGLGASVIGMALLVGFVNLVAGTLAGLALLSYVLVYTPLKRSTPYALHVGAVPGAIPPLIGYAAVMGQLDSVAYLLFSILLVWQLPHFMAIAIFRQTDYRAAGLLVFPVAFGVKRTQRAIGVYSALLLAATLLPVVLGAAGLAYGIIAAVSGIGFLAWGLYGLKAKNSVKWARSLFLASMPHLVVVFAALVASAM